MDDKRDQRTSDVIEDADMESISLSLNPAFMKIIERPRKRQETEGGISSDEMRRRFGGSA